MNGLVLIDKPSGCTSHDVVNRWRRLAQTKRVGHLGTLDPMATGLLALVTGNATRLAQFFGNEDKSYFAEITLGLTSDTYDADGQILRTDSAAEVEREAIVEALNGFRGCIMQTPPPVSAKKIQGVPAYKLARRNMVVDIAPVAVKIKQLDIEYIHENDVRVSIVCSAGTYIRSLAHDLGQKLKCGAILSGLRRTRIGEFGIEYARSLDELGEMASAGRLADAVIPAAQLLPQFPAEHFDRPVEAQIRQGRDFRTSPFVVPPGTRYVKALSSSGELIAIGTLRLPNVYHPSTVL